MDEPDRDGMYDARDRPWCEACAAPIVAFFDGKVPGQALERWRSFGIDERDHVRAAMLESRKLVGVLTSVAMAASMLLYELAPAAPVRERTL